MKALLSRAAGGPDTLEIGEVDDPKPGAGQVLVRVAACSVNFPDVLTIEDKYQFRPPRPFAPGVEIAGVVEGIGAGVDHVAPGDRVMAGFRWGGMAELAVVERHRVAKIPDAMPMEEAAAFGLTYGTSYHALKVRGGLKAGDNLLVLGAAGGVGLAAVELGKALGARVVAAVSTEEKAEICRHHGADETVIYGRGPYDAEGRKGLTEAFKQAAGERGFDVIYDPVGDAYAEPALRAIAWEGRYLVVGFAAGDIPKIPLNLTLLKGCQIVGVFWGSWVDRNPDLHREATDELLALYAAGKVKPFVSETFPFERGGDAIAHLASRKALGKVVVRVNETLA